MIPQLPPFESIAHSCLFGNCNKVVNSYQSYKNISYFILNFNDLLVSKINDLSFFTYLQNGYEIELPLIKFQISQNVINDKIPEYQFIHWNSVSNERKKLIAIEASKKTNLFAP